MSEVHLHGPTNLASPNSVREITLEATQEKIDIFESTPIHMPPESGGIRWRLT